MILDKRAEYLAQKAGMLLTADDATVTVAESCTGGGVGYAITSVPGASAWFKQGFITYSNDAKNQLLGVPNPLLEQYGAVSGEVVSEMAVGARLACHAEYAIAVSGIAGPDGGSLDKPVGLVWFGWSGPGDEVVAISHTFEGDRRAIREQAICFALETLVASLEKRNKNTV